MRVGWDIAKFSSVWKNSRQLAACPEQVEARSYGEEAAERPSKQVGWLLETGCRFSSKNICTFKYICTFFRVKIFVLWAEGQSIKISNFGGFVLGCIGTDLCKWILILQRFSRSTRNDSRKLFKTSEFWENLGTKFCRFSKKMSNSALFSCLKIVIDSPRTPLSNKSRMSFWVPILS